MPPLDHRFGPLLVVVPMVNHFEHMPLPMLSMVSHKVRAHEGSSYASSSNFFNESHIFHLFIFGIVKLNLIVLYFFLNEKEKIGGGHINVCNILMISTQNPYHMDGPAILSMNGKKRMHLSFLFKDSIAEHPRGMGVADLIKLCYLRGASSRCDD